MNCLVDIAICAQKLAAYVEPPAFPPVLPSLWHPYYLKTIPQKSQPVKTKPKTATSLLTFADRKIQAQ